MDVTGREIHFYRTSDGKIPFQEWRSALEDPRSRDLIRARLARLRAGNFGDCKFIGQGLFELRVFYGPGYRIYFGHLSARKLLILIAGDKDSQVRDIQKALSYWADYRRRS